MNKKIIGIVLLAMMLPLSGCMMYVGGDTTPHTHYEYRIGNLTELRFHDKTDMVYVFLANGLNGSHIDESNGSDGYALCKPFLNKTVNITLRCVYIKDYGDEAFDDFCPHNFTYVEAIREM